jgi:hypothetical protein
LKELTQYAVNYLEKYNNLLADEFQHYFFASVFDKGYTFPVYTILVDREGRNIELLGPDHPSKVMSVLYPTLYPNASFLETEYKEIAQKYKKIVYPETSFGIVQAPLKLVAYRVNGDERFIKKLIFSEKLKGQNYLSLSLNINDQTLQFIIDYFKKWLNGVFYFPYLSDIHVVFRLPEYIESNKVSIYIELGRLLKEKVLKKYPFLENSYKLPEMRIKEPVIAVFKIPADKITEVDFQSLYEKMIDKISKIVLEIDKIEID